MARTSQPSSVSKTLAAIAGVERSCKAFDAFTGLERNRKALDIVMGVERHQKALRTLTGQSALSRMNEVYGSKSVIDQMRVLSDATDLAKQMRVVSGTKQFAEQMRVLSGTEGVAKQARIITSTSSAPALARNRDLLASIAGRPRLIDVIGGQKTFAEMVAAPRVASLVGAATMPRPAWASVLEDLRPAIGDDLYEETAAGFDAVSELAGDGETWWVGRLPPVAQLALLVLVLEGLDAAGAFIADVTGTTPMPPAYRSGVKMMFALAAVLLWCINARSQADSDGSDDEADDEERDY